MSTLLHRAPSQADEIDVKYGKYEIKNVKYMKSLSEETPCFSLDLFVDGKKFAHVSNRGHGGCNDTRLYAPFTYEDEKRVTEEMVTDKFLVDSEYEQFDAAVSTLFSMWEAAKDITGNCKKKAVYLRDGNLHVTGYKDKAAPDKRLFDHIKSKYPDAVILNGMEIDEASKLVVVAERAKYEAEYGTGVTSPTI